MKAEWTTQKAEQAQKTAAARNETNQKFLDLPRVLWNSTVNIAQGTVNTLLDAAQINGGQTPLRLLDPTRPQVDFSGAKTDYRSEMMRRNLHGKVDGEGIKAGQTIETGVTLVAPIVVGAATVPKAAPQSLKNLGGIPNAGVFRQVATGGLRNEVNLTETQKVDVLKYAEKFGIAEENVIFSENMNTSYKLLFGQDRLYVGTDVLPATGKSLAANSRISMRGAIAHELEGHRVAELAGKTNVNALLEEVQASIRAARFAPDLTNTERITLIRDAVERLHKAGLKVREVKGELWITKDK